MINDKKFRVPRIWSNNELKKFSHLFTGNVVNVSAWKDSDKEGNKYKDYFINANSYSITNYKENARGYQGLPDEIFLDLEQTLDINLINKYDIIFSHTALEHIYNVKTAFKNICLLSKDIVVLVVPFVQEMHSDYGDYWRFTPLVVKRMFEENNMKVLYSSFNEHKKTSVYLFFIASKQSNKWKDKIYNNFSYKSKTKYLTDVGEKYIGNNVIKNNWLITIKSVLYDWWSK